MKKIKNKKRYIYIYIFKYKIEKKVASHSTSTGKNFQYHDSPEEASSESCRYFKSAVSSIECFLCFLQANALGCI